MVNVLQCIWQEGVWGNKGKTLWAINPSACRSASQSASNGLIKENSNLWERHPPRWEPGPHWAVLSKDGGFSLQVYDAEQTLVPKVICSNRISQRYWKDSYSTDVRKFTYNCNNCRYRRPPSLFGWFWSYSSEPPPPCLHEFHTQILWLLADFLLLMKHKNNTAVSLHIYTKSKHFTTVISIREFLLGRTPGDVLCTSSQSASLLSLRTGIQLILNVH